MQEQTTLTATFPLKDTNTQAWPRMAAICSGDHIAAEESAGETEQLTD